MAEHDEDAEKTQPSQTLGEFIREARAGLGLTQSAVAEAAKISAAYQKKLEDDGVTQPSPNVLYREAKVLDVPYAVLMQLAGYVLPDATETPVAHGLDYALSSGDLTDNERQAVTAFIAHLREQRK